MFPWRIDEVGIARQQTETAKDENEQRDVVARNATLVVVFFRRWARSSEIVERVFTVCEWAVVAAVELNLLWRDSERMKIQPLC